MISRYTKIAALLILLVSTAFAQQAHTPDSLRSPFSSKPKFLFKFDTRNSFVSNSRRDIFGIKLGMEFDKKVRLGAGVNWLKSPIYKTRYLTSSAGLPDSVEAQLQFRYIAYYVEYVFYRSKRWELSMPFQLGAGYSRYVYNYEGSSFIENRKMILVYEPSISMQYKVFKWLGAGADVGFRLMVLNNKAIKENFNSPLYAFKVLVWYGELYKSLFPKTWLAKKLGDH
jgi:hypothetical protein